MKRSDVWFNGLGWHPVLPVIGVCALLAGLFTGPIPTRGDQPASAPSQPSVDQGKAPDSKTSTKLGKESSSAPSLSQESKSSQLENQASKDEESRSKGEEGPARDGAKKTVSSLILTVKLALLADPRLFPYEIEVETGSDEVTLSGKVSNETEKSVAAEIGRTVSGVRSVVNKIEVVKDLQEVLAQRRDDAITNQIKERFAKSATVKAAGFDVKTERGVVSLRGTVRFQVIVLEAAEAARQVPGVKAVKTDKVKIESEG